MRTILANLAVRLSLLIAFALLPTGALGAEWTMTVTARGQRLEGAPLAWSNDNVELLARDGGWFTFGMKDAEDYRKTSDAFRPLTQGEMRALVIGELGGGFEVSGTGNYLVAHPAGKRSQWAERFEALYRTFVQYFAVRGFRLQSPRFPLVAVVFPTRHDFAAYAARQGFQLPEGVLGYYSRKTNRILLYDLTTDAGEFSGSDNADTIVHEATHQMAFNTGVHNRFGPTPTWVAEGLATTFEAPGVHDARRHTSLESRVNRGRLTSLRRYVAERQTGQVLAAMVQSDRLFQTNPDAAYAHAWALTFYLSEQYPREYGRYLAKVAAKPAFAEYSLAERLQDFTAEFGDDFAMLESRLLRFVEKLP